MKPLSLKTKLALAVSCFFLLFGSAMGWVTFTYFQREFKESIGVQQHALVSLLAHELDSKFAFARQSLVAAAAAVPPEVFADPRAARAFLDTKTTLHLLFDNGLFLFAPEGKPVAESPVEHDPRHHDISATEHFKRTVATGRPQFSSPHSSPHAPGHSTVMVTAPVFDRRGAVRGVLAGSIDLLGKSFPEIVPRHRIGKSGYVYLTSRERIVIYHPDPQWVLQYVPEGRNLLFDRAVAGFEGSGETLTTKGVPVLSSFKRLNTNDWILAVSFPQAEAYAPLHDARRYFITAAVVGIVFMLVLSWLFMGRLMRPLSRFTRHVDEIALHPEEGRPVEIAGGDEIGTLAAAFNRMMEAITKRQDALRKSEAKFATLFNSAPSIMTISTLAEGRFIDVNEAFEKTLGYRRDQVIGRTSVELGIWENAEERGRFMAQLRANGRIRNYEFRQRTAAGRSFVGLISGEIIEIGGEKYLLVLVNDISERKEHEERIGRLNAELERRVRERTAELEGAVREMETFCYTVSHDLRTPLRGINGFCSILLDEYRERLDQEGENYLCRIAAAAARMGELIDDLLTLARVSRGEMRCEEVDLSAAAREIAVDLAQGYPGRSVELVVAEGLTVNGDPVLLRAALENLLANAWKFSSRTQSPRVEVGAVSEGLGRVFFVRDNGVGFDMAYADKLFIPFHRLHAGEGFEGTGIGLSAVQRVVERHGGRIWAESEPGRGATFFFTLPGVPARPELRHAPPGRR